MNRNPAAHHVASVPLVVGAIAGIVGLVLAIVDRSWWGVTLAVALLVLASAAYIDADRQRMRD